jgi:phosphatidylinositol glycan class V
LSFRWDGQYFLHIADNGYTYENTLAFFPLYPFCVRILSEAIYWAQVEYALIHFTSALKLSAILVNIGAFVLAAVILHDLSRKGKITESIQ